MNINKDISETVRRWIDMQRYSKVEICEELGMSRPTLDKRLEKHNWKKLEIKLIVKLR